MTTPGPCHAVMTWFQDPDDPDGWRLVECFTCLEPLGTAYGKPGVEGLVATHLGQGMLLTWDIETIEVSND